VSLYWVRFCLFHDQIPPTSCSRHSQPSVEPEGSLSCWKESVSLIPVMPSFVRSLPIYYWSLPSGTFNALYTNFQPVLFVYPVSEATGAFRWPSILLCLPGRECVELYLYFCPVFARNVTEQPLPFHLNS